MQGRRASHYEVLAPPDLERIFGLDGGSIFQGEQGLDQMAFMRPSPQLSRYATPVDGLYLCGAGTHPGGGVIAASGHNAAQRVLRDQRRARLRERVRHPLAAAPERPFRRSLANVSLDTGYSRSKDRGTLNESSSSADEGLSRRSLLGARGRPGSAAGAAAGVAGCENTTDAGRRRRARAAAAKGILGDPTAGGPVDASGIPLARRDYPVTLPRIGDPVKSSRQARDAAASCGSTTTPTTSTRPS